MEQPAQALRAIHLAGPDLRPGAEPRRQDQPDGGRDDPVSADPSGIVDEVHDRETAKHDGRPQEAVGTDVNLVRLLCRGANVSDVFLETFLAGHVILRPCP